MGLRLRARWLLADMCSAFGRRGLGLLPYPRPKLSRILALSAAVALAACAEPDTNPGGPDRGPLGKADVSGSCEGACGGQGAGTCWCDDQCIDYGDCCGDYETICAEPSVEPPDDSDAVPVRCELRAEGGAPSPIGPPDLHDAVSRAVLTGAGPCPTSLEDILDALRTDYEEHCEGFVSGQGLRASVVSERAQITGRAENYRAVLTRQCGFNQAADLFGLVFEFEANDEGTFPEALPEGLEFIASDPEQRVFNFYAVVDGHWTYFGDSRDMIAEGAKDEILCARCHTSGGLVMREKAMPWPHWGSEFGGRLLPGQAQLREQFPVLPPHPWGGAGQGTEDLVHGNNALWAEARIDHLREDGTTRALLEPLFCGTDFNLVSEGYRGSFTNGSSFDVRCPPGEPACGFDGVSTQLFVPEAQLLTSRRSFAMESYFEAVAENGQRMLESFPDGLQLVHDDGVPVFESPFGVMYPVPAHVDNLHIWSLVEEGLLDRDFVVDTLMIDFTRPVFSAARCGMLDLVPELGPGVTPDKLRAAMTDILASTDQTTRSPHESAYLNALRDVADAGEHAETLENFLLACGQRVGSDNDAFTRDVLAYVSLLRDKIRHVPMMRGPENLPVDDQVVDPTAHFDPVSCELVTD